jgi:excinuclease ABC subunit A
MSQEDWVEVFGGAEHNLKHIHVRFPRNRLVLFTGVSGSGKSSLAFDTVYVEGQRRYIESLSSYARQFLGQLERPHYERITGLCPTVAIEQKKASSNPRSTVGTVTEVLDYLRVLYARAGVQRCHRCHQPVGKQDAQSIIHRLAALPAGSTVQISAPLVHQRKGEFRTLFEDALKQGFVRFRVDGEVLRLESPPGLDKNRKHDIDIVVDRVKIRPDIAGRLADTVETALRAGKGRLTAETDGTVMRFSEDLYCPDCEVSLPELSPQLFSFNSPLGACPACHGLGLSADVDMEKVFRNENETLYQAMQRVTLIWQGRRRGWKWQFWNAVEEQLQLSPRTLVKRLPQGVREVIVRGIPKSAGMDGPEFPGLWGYVEKDLGLTSSEAVRNYYSQFFRESTCAACEGTRLRPEAKAVTLQDHSLTDLCRMSVSALLAFLDSLSFDETGARIAAEPLREIRSRLSFLAGVGLDYLTLDRVAHSLSGGEAQRIRLARQLGAELSGVIYVLDEPSIGLHPRDTARLVATLKRLRDLGNTVLVVEHDPETVRQADWVVDFGPLAGHLGGEVMYSGDLAGLLECPASLTGQYLSGRTSLSVPETRRVPSKWLTFKDIHLHNLRGIDVSIPLGCFTVVTGVSGAGKSSLVAETIRPILEARVGKLSTTCDARVGEVTGLSHLDKVIVIDQKPIGRTPRSNPATYTKVLDAIRQLFAATREAKAFGYQAGRFSFNVKGGRCEKCAGDGTLTVEMHFLPDVSVRCPQCKGKRFNDATLRVKYRGLDISEVLDLTVEEALAHFASISAIVRVLSTMADVGLGYMKLGQASTTLSGGEAQRIKLSRELARREREHTFYILDEPTTGLHFHDVSKLLGVVHRLVDSGHSVLMVEHNLDIVRSADHIIDLGPEGGDAGGRVVATGTPEEVAAVAQSVTGRFLRRERGGG